MRGLIVIAAILCFVVTMRKRPSSIVVTATLLWIFIPYTGLPVVWGGQGPSILIMTHPATILVLLNLYFVILGNLPDFTRHIFRSAGTHFTLLMFFLVVTVSYLFIPSSRLGPIFNEIIGPLIAYVTLRFHASRTKTTHRNVSYALLGAATVQSILVIVQSAMGRMLPFEHYYLVQPWFSISNDRWFGTLDHPLVLGMFLACMTFLLAEIPSVLLRFSLASLFMMAILLSQSRTALMVCAAGVTFLVLHSSARSWQRLLLIPTTIAAPIILWSFFSSSNTYARFIDDGGSAGARSDAAATFFAEGLGGLLHGGGSGYSYVFAAQHHLSTSLENSFMMYSLDFGVIPTLLYFGSMIWLVLRASHQREPLHLIFAAIAAILLVLSFSSIAAESASAFLLWTLLGLLPTKDNTPQATTDPKLAGYLTRLRADRAQSPRMTKTQRATDRIRSNANVRLSPSQKVMDWY